MSELLSKAIEAKLDAASIVALIGYAQCEVADKRQAAFDAAFVAFQSEVPVIGKSRRVKVEHRTGGSHEYSYAELDHVAQIVRPILAKHGLYCAFDVRTESTSVHAKCIVRHKDGGERSSEFTAPIDQAQKVNDTQKVGSAQSYARRYAYIAVLGLTIAGDDDDAQGAGKASGPTVTAEQAVELSVLLKETASDEAKFLGWLKAATLEAIPAADFDKAKRSLEAKKAKK